MLQTAQSFGQKQTDLAQFAAAMAHPARIAILERLQQEPEACCGDLVKALPLAQSTVSQHLKVLVAAGLVATRREGHHVLYRLQRDRIRNFCQAFQASLGTQPLTPDSLP
jgi:ArsR family transcriptional regulator